MALKVECIVLKREHLKYVVPRLSRTKVAAVQYDARRSVKGVGRHSHRRSLQLLSGELLTPEPLMARQK